MGTGGLPKGWSEAPLADLIAPDGIFCDGDWVESKDQDPDGDVRLVQLADIGDGEFRDRSNRSLNSDTAQRLRCTFLEPGDVLVARMPDPLGRACVYPGGPRKAATVVDVRILRPGRSGVNPKWLMWAINSPQVRSQIYRYQTGSTRKRISGNNLGQVRLLVPPLAEQLRIVEALEEKLSRLDAASSSVDRAFRRLSELLHAVVDSELRAASNCPHTALRDVLSEPLRNGHSAKATTDPDGVRTLSLTAVTSGQFSNANTKVTVADRERVKGLWLEPGDLLIQRSNTPELVGTAALFDGERDWAIFPDLLIRVRLTSRVIPEYALLELQSRPGRAYFKSHAKGLSGSMPKIDQATIEGFTFPVPDLEVQKRIVDRVASERERISRLTAELVKSRRRAIALRSALLRNAFSGNLVPQTPADEPAATLLARIAAERDAVKPARKAKRAARPRKATTATAKPAPVSTPAPVTTVQQELFQ
jgi:type I restriction enzyme S subunit